MLNDKEHVGLSIGGLGLFNLALLYKWRCRFLNDQNLLWVKLIKSCYGSDGGFSMGTPNRTKSGVCMGIVKLVWKIHHNSLIPYDVNRWGMVIIQDFGRMFGMVISCFNLGSPSLPPPYFCCSF